MFKKYRSVFLMTFFLLFNLGESFYFGYGTSKGYNLFPSCISEWLCDIISFGGMFWAFVMGLYDVNGIKRHFVLDITENKQD